PGESPIPGVTVTLTGTDDLGNPVNVPQLTAADGSFFFGNLRPGTYTLTETQPTIIVNGQPVPYGDGLDGLGTINGTLNGVYTNNAVADVFATIVVKEEDAGVNYN